jgi:hypothetical protein
VRKKLEIRKKFKALTGLLGIDFCIAATNKSIRAVFICLEQFFDTVDIIILFGIDIMN